LKDLTRIVEALLFSADGPLKIEQVQEVVPNADAEAVAEAFDELRRFYAENQRAFGVVRIAGGFQLLTLPDVAIEVERFLMGRRRQRLSRAALEVLAVVAYKQPVTRGDVETIRGVDCGGVFRTLLERRLVVVKGRAATVGHPLLYGTGDHFLEHFGIESLKDLPKIEEFESLVDRDAAREDLVRAGAIPDAAREDLADAGAIPDTQGEPEIVAACQAAPVQAGEPDPGGEAEA
jgi:segregation and condensation protein B